MYKRLTEPYCIDLGNGFTKITKDGNNVRTEPSVYAKVVGGFQMAKLPTVNVFDRELHIGNDALESGKKINYVLGEEERYFSKEYKELLFGFIAKDFEHTTDVDIPLLMLGLPVYHFDKVKDKLEATYTDKKTVKYNGKPITINIQKVIVLPQNIGTFGYLMDNEFDLTASRSLIVDAGHGTLDIVAMKGLQREAWYGEREGMSQAYLEIRTFLSGEFSGYKLTTHDIEKAVRNGGKLEAAGNADIFKYPEVISALDDHWKAMYDFIYELYPRLDQFDHVVFTGGASLNHKTRIKETLKDVDTELLILDEGQNANVLGYYGLGMEEFDEPDPVQVAEE